MNFALDASVALSWCFEDEGGAYSTDVLSRLRDGEAVVPTLWTLEVMNGLVTAGRRGRLEPGDAAEFTRTLLDLPIAVDPAERSRAFLGLLPLARAQGLSGYDAAYLELAMRRGLPLATLDERLAAAAEAVGVGRL